MKKKFGTHFARFLVLTVIFLGSSGAMLLTILDHDNQHNHQWLIDDASYFEEKFYDLRMEMTLNPNKKNHQLVLAALDDQTFQQVGRWPWTRTRWVEVLRKLKIFGASIVVFDVVFPEPELACKNSNDLNIDQIDPDRSFSKAITSFQGTNGKVILAYALADQQKEAFHEMPAELYDFVLNTKAGPNQFLVEKKVSASNFPIPVLLAAKPQLGHIGASSDADGVFRSYSLLSNIESTYFPSLGFLAYTLSLPQAVASKIETQITADGAIIKLGRQQLFLNRNGETKIRFLGGADNFDTVSMIKILNASDQDRELKKLFSGKIVFIGSTAFGAHDIRHTPVDAQLPGVYFHMNLVNMLQTGFFFKDKDESIFYSLLFLALGLLLLFAVQYANDAIADLIGIFLLIGGLFYLDLHYFTPQGYELKLFFCFFGLFLFYSWNTFINFYRTSREKKQIKNTFSRYVAPAIVNEMLGHPEKLKIGGEKREITVIFSDVRDFTSISEKLTPQQLSSCLNYYMGIMTDILFATHGTLDKYIGDALVGYWGAPLDVPKHAYHGVCGALKMIEVLPEINQHFSQLQLPHFDIGIGINTGECSVGNMGSDKIFSYTAIGDHMNLGSRLEALCKTYGTQILISEFTVQAIGEEKMHEFFCREIDLVKVKGKEKTVKIYELLHLQHPYRQHTSLLTDYHRGYHFYLQGDFSATILNFEQLLKQLPEGYEDKTTKRHLQAAKNFVLNPPLDWDGVTIHHSKG